MKRITNILMTCALALPVFMAVGCSGNDEGTPTVEDKVTLEPSKTSIVANGTDQVTFTVKSGDQTVTTAKISYTDPSGAQKELEGTAFSTKTAGDYTFTATYESKASSAVKITATVPAEEKYFRRVCAIDVTGTWCTNCPAAGQALDLLSQNRPDRIVILAVHGDGTSTDPMTTPVTDMLDKMFKITGFPMGVVDLRTSVDAAGFAGGVIDAYDESRKNYPATCGLRMESSYNEATNKIDITVGITSNTGGAYRLAALILEDDIVAPQIQNGLTIPNYKHKHVVRKLLSTNLVGDSVGELKADTEVTKEFSTEVDPSWNVDNLRVAIYATDASGSINNIIEGKAKNGSCDYKYNE